MGNQADYFNEKGYRGEYDIGIGFLVDGIKFLLSEVWEMTDLLAKLLAPK